MNDEVRITHHCFIRWRERAAKPTEWNFEKCRSVFDETIEVEASPAESRRFVHTRRKITFIVDREDEQLVVKTVVLSRDDDLRQANELKRGVALRGGL